MAVNLSRQNGAKYSRMNQVKFVEDSLYGLMRLTMSLQIFKCCLPQILLGPFLNILPQLSLLPFHSLIFEPKAGF